MTTVVLLSGLLCDETVWQPVIDRFPDAKVADFSSHDDLTQMARDCLEIYSGDLVIAGHSMGARITMEMPVSGLIESNEYLFWMPVFTH